MSTLGVDLGTDSARAAVATDKEPRLLTFAEGAPSIPAVVAFQQATVRVGRAAVEKSAIHPERAVRGVKRLLGRAADDPIALSIARYAPFQVVPREGGALSLVVDGVPREPEDVAAAIFAHLADTAAEALGERPTSAVLTAPHHFGARQRRALSEAAHRAGLEPVQILSEGTATALSIAAAEPSQRRVAIADVGAGGVTVSILEVGPARVLLLGSAGDPAGGGDDIDRGLLRAVIEGLRSRWGDFPDPPAVHEMLLHICARMKRDLGDLSEARVVVPFLPIGPRGLRHEEIRVDRAHFEPLLADTLARVEATARGALAAAQVSPTQLSAVYATGGLANIPVVRAPIERVLGRITSRKLDPDGAVALGAAVQAGMLAGLAEAIPVVDVQGATMPPPAMPPSIPPAAVRTAPPDARASSSAISSVPPVRAPSVSDAPPADELRLELAQVLASVNAGAVTGVATRPDARVLRESAVVDDDDLVDTERRADMTARLASIWNQLGLALTSARQYRFRHPVTARHLSAALREIEEALSLAPRSVRFDVGPAALLHDRQPIYRPDRPPLDRIPRQLHADGLRVVQLRQGLAMDELTAFLDVLLAAANGFAIDQDVVSVLWEQGFAHIAHVAVDAFVADDVDFERERDRITADLAATCDAEIAAAIGGSAARRRELIERALSVALPSDALAALVKSADVPPEVHAARLAASFPAAYREAERYGDGERITAALDGFAEERVLLGDPEGLVRRLADISAAFEAVEGITTALEVERELTAVMLPRARLDALFARLGEAAVSPALAEALSRALSLHRDPELHGVVESAYWTGAVALRDALLPYLVHAGHEASLGRVLHDGSQEHGLVALERLAALGTPAARQAIHQAFESPHLELRVAAIAHLPGASADAARAELTALLEDPEPSVRLRALSVVGRLDVVVAGPVLVRRIQSGALDALPLPERRLLLRTLAELSPTRAEAIALDLLGETHVLPSRSADETRVIAAEVLGSIGGPDALAALVRAAKKRWLNTAEVRRAAESAARAAAARLGVRLTERP